jgi:hypothetical protein
LVLIGSEVYPSIADILWVVGYVFLFLPFFLLYRLLRITPDTKVVALVFSFAIAFVTLAAVYVILPIVQDANGSLVQKALGVVYPIGDLIIALGALVLALALLGGAFSWVWTFIAVGLLFQTFSDTLFTYADWNGLYLPNGSVNLLSVVVDVTYLLGYVLLALGIYIQIQFTVNDIEEPLVSRYKSVGDAQNELFQTVKITIFTNAEDNLISVSPNIAYLLPPEKKSLDMDGLPFDQVIGLDRENAQEILRYLKENGSMSNWVVNLTAADGPSVTARMNGIANFNVSGVYIGSDIFMSVPIRVGELAMGELTAVDMLAGDAPENAIRKLTSTFFAEKINALYVTISRFGGANAARSLQRTFNANARRHEIEVQMDGPNIIFDTKNHDVSIYRNLLRDSVNYAIAVVSLEILSREIEKWESKLDPVLVQAGKDTGLYGLKLE